MPIGNTGSPSRFYLSLSGYLPSLLPPQTRLLHKLGPSAHPFLLSFPRSAPNSVLIRGDEGDAQNMGVTYDVRLHLADHQVGRGKAVVAAHYDFRLFL